MSLSLANTNIGQRMMIKMHQLSTRIRSALPLA
jgi:hypothetical protein